MNEDDDRTGGAEYPDPLTELFAAGEAGEEEWLSERDPRDPAVVFQAAERAMSRPKGPSRARWRPSWRIVSLGSAALVLLVAVVVLVLQLNGPSGALADPTQAAAAAQEAKRFAFETESQLYFGSQLQRNASASGEVNLTGTGSFRVHVHNGGERFERIVLSDAVYFRGIGAHGASAWLGARLEPTVSITPYNASGGGLGDPLGLTGVLHTHPGARSLGEEPVEGTRAQHYAINLTLGAFLPAGSSASARIKSIPVEVQVWQEHRQRLLRAVRTFKIGGRKHETLVVTTRFRNYGKPTRFVVPHRTPLIGHQRLDPAVDDPLGASVLHALVFGTDHRATPVGRQSARGRARRVGRGRFVPAR